MLPKVMRRTPTAEEIGLLAIEAEVARITTTAYTSCLLWEPAEPADYHTGYPGCEGTRPCRENDDVSADDWCSRCRARDFELKRTNNESGFAGGE